MVSAKIVCKPRSKIEKRFIHSLAVDDDHEAGICIYSSVVRVLVQNRIDTVGCRSEHASTVRCRTRHCALNRLHFLALATVGHDMSCNKREPTGIHNVEVALVTVALNSCCFGYELTKAWLWIVAQGDAIIQQQPLIQTRRGIVAKHGRRRRNPSQCRQSKKTCFAPSNAHSKAICESGDWALDVSVLIVCETSTLAFQGRHTTKRRA